MKARNHGYGSVFVLLGAALLWLAWNSGNSLEGWISLSAAASSWGVGVAYILSWPGLLGKRRTGTLVPSSYALFWPYHLFNYAALFLARRLLGEAPSHEVAPGLYLGARLFPWERAATAPLNIRGVLDLTCEFSETEFFRKVPAYCCLPLLDGTAPTPEQLGFALDFLRRQLPAGPVYVHCAMGHGRSATVVVAFLVASGRFPNVDSALRHVRSLRPGVKLKNGQAALLTGYFK